MGKYLKKDTPKAGVSKVLVLGAVAAALLLALLILAVIWILGQEVPGEYIPEIPATETETESMVTEAPAEQPETEPVEIQIAEKVDINVGYGMYIRDVAKYAGIYMEDGTDEIVSDVLMIMVENTGEQDIQYAEIEMPVGGETAYFKLSTLPAGESVVLLEVNRMVYGELDYTTAVAANVVLFDEPLSRCEDQLEIQILNGAMNISNISDEDITGDIVVYYKNSSSDMLYGGITYRITISGGLKAGEIKQITGGHVSTSNSRIMWVTIG